MKHFPGWQALFLSFYSPALYKDVAKNWTGLAFLYLLAVISATSILVSIQINNWVAQLIEQNIAPICDQMPKLTIDNGKASIDKPCPYKIVDPKTDQVLITFDTRKDSPYRDSVAEGAALITSSALIMKDPSTSGSYQSDTSSNSLPASLSAALENTKDEKLKAGLLKAYKEHPESFKTKDVVTSFSTLQHFSLDRSGLNDFISVCKQWTWLLVFSMLMPLYLAICIIQVLIYALFGKGMCGMLNCKLPYAALVRLSVMALTPVLLIDPVLKVRGLMFGFWGPLAVLITLSYLFFAVKVNSQAVPLDTEVKADTAAS